MKKCFLLLSLVFLSFCVQAQPPENRSGMRAGTGNSSGHVYGKIVDASGKAVADASVILLQSKPDTATGKLKNTLLKGVATGAKGEFEFEDLPVSGRLLLKVSVAGFNDHEQTVSFFTKPTGTPVAGTPTPMNSASFDKDLGKIKLTESIKELQGVTVTTTKSLLKLDIDKKVFNVDKNIVSEGGTGVDIMKNVPSVNVDIDGAVTIRNSTPQLFVDGRPTTLTLEQIPSSAIESVEIMTNPSSKYDASGGGAGILNIVLKKNKKTGYNGTVRVGIDKYGEVNTGADLNVRQGKFNVSTGLNVRALNGRSYSTTNRTNITDVPVTSINQVSAEKTNGTMAFGKLGVDYFLDNKTTLSLSGVRMHGQMNPTSVLDIRTDSLYSQGIFSSYSQRLINMNRTFDGSGLVFGMKHIFKPGEEWTVDANYFTGKNSASSMYNTNQFATGKASEITDAKMQEIVSAGNDRNLILQTDYVKALNSTTKLETGIRAALRDRVNANNNYLYDYTTSQFVYIPSAASNYKSNDHVYAAYASIASSIKDFSYKVGLRAESSDYTGELTDTKQSFSNKYPVSLFPTLFLSQKLGNQQDIQLSYTRRINRPNFFQLIPFVDSSDNLNISKGNAALVPEFTQSLEMNYLKQFKGNNTLLASVYYKQTRNLITRYLYQETDPATGNTALVNTFINANSSRSTGAELTVQNTLTKWLSTTTDLNLYNSKINTGSAITDNPAMWSWFGKFNSNIKLPNNLTVQLSGMYQSKTNLPANTNSGGGMGGGGGAPGMVAQTASQGYINPYYSVDFAIKKTFLNNKFSASISVNDIFKTRSQNQYSSSNYFVQDYNRVRDQQMVRLNLAYSFGKIDALLFKRKSQGTGQTGSEIAQ